MVSGQVHQGWVASLSNGETVFETPPVPGERTSWKNLIHRCVDENIRITQMRLQVGGKTIVAVPNAGGYAFFKRMRRTGLVAREMGATPQVLTFACLGIVVGDNVVINVLDAQGDIKMEIQPLSTARVHCWLKDD